MPRKRRACNLYTWQFSFSLFTLIPGLFFEIGRPLKRPLVRRQRHVRREHASHDRAEGRG